MLTIDLNPIKEFRYNQIGNHNFNFLLLDKKLRAVHSPFQCKDYLQDIFFCEYTGQSANIYGMSWKQGMFDTTGPRFNMALMGGKAVLRDSMKTMQAFVNIFEKAIKIPKSKIEETNIPENVVIRFSKKWTENGPLLSTFTTLIRLSGAYKEGDPFEYLQGLLKYVRENPTFYTTNNNPFPPFMNVDLMRLESYIWKLKAVLEGEKVQHKWTDFTNIQYVHDVGISRYADYPQRIPQKAGN